MSTQLRCTICGNALGIVCDEDGVAAQCPVCHSSFLFSKGAAYFHTDDETASQVAQTRTKLLQAMLRPSVDIERIKNLTNMIAKHLMDDLLCKFILAWLIWQGRKRDIRPLRDLFKQLTSGQLEYSSSELADICSVLALSVERPELHMLRLAVDGCPNAKCRENCLAQISHAENLLRKEKYPHITRDEFIRQSDEQADQKPLLTLPRVAIDSPPGPMSSVTQISCGRNHLVCLRQDGRVITGGDNNYGQLNVADWQELTAVFCGANCTVGLSTSGRILICGDNRNNQCQVADWRDIIAVSCGAFHTVGLRSDGGLLASGNNEHGQCQVTAWHGVMAVTCRDYCTLAITNKGYLLSTGLRNDAERESDGWRKLRKIACGSLHTVGLRQDGTVVACGYNNQHQCNVQGWSNVTAIACGSFHTVALMQNGSVVACGNNSNNQCDVSGWSNITAIACCSERTVGLRRDGRVLITGRHDGLNPQQAWRLGDQ